MKDWHVSPLKHCEIEIYLAMLNQFRADEGLPHTLVNASHLRQSVFTTKRRLAIHVARNKTCIAGFISFKKFYEPGSGLDGFHLCDLFVKDQYRRSGIGKDLLASCKRVATATEKSFIWWVTQTDNEIALSLFKKMGVQYSMIYSFVLNI